MRAFCEAFGLEQMDLIHAAEACAMRAALKDVSLELRSVEQDALRVFAGAYLFVSPSEIVPALNYALETFSAKVRILEMGGLNVRVIFLEDGVQMIGWPQNYDRIQAIVSAFLPCHAGIEFYIRVLTWSECHRVRYTWAFAENKTWEEFMKSVP